MDVIFHTVQAPTHLEKTDQMINPFDIHNECTVKVFQKDY